MAAETYITLKYHSCSREHEYRRCTLASAHASSVQLTSSILRAWSHVEQVAMSHGSCFNTTAPRSKQPRTSACSWAGSTLKGSSVDQIKSVHQVSRFNQELLCFVHNNPKGLQLEDTYRLRVTHTVNKLQTDP